METAVPLGDALALGAAFAWSAAVVLFKRSGDFLPPMALNLFKNVVGLALLTLTIPLAGGELLTDVPASTWLLLAASGVLGISIADTLFFDSLGRLGAGLSAAVDTCYTPIVLLLSFFWLDERIGPADLVGGALIASGILIGVAARPPAGRTRRDVAWGAATGVVAMAAMAVSVVMIKERLNDLPVLWVTWVRVVAGTAGCFVAVGAHPGRRAILASLRPDRGWWWAVPASVSGTWLAMLLWVGGMKFTLVSRSSLLNQLSTAFVFVLATVFLREPLTRRRVGAIGLAMAGALLVVG